MSELVCWGHLFCAASDWRVGNDTMCWNRKLKIAVRISMVWACGILVAVPAFAGGSWPAFRGANGVGVAPEAILPIHFDETTNVVWKTKIPGWGHSSPVVWGDQVWMTTASEDGLRMSAVCVDASSGEIIHELLLFENESVNPNHHPANSYASCTPVIEEGRVYCHFGHYGTACLDTATGRVIWKRRDIEVDEFRGPGSSPILFENLLLVLCDGVDRQFVLALNQETGKTVWRTKRTIDYGTDNGDLKKGYGTPAIFEIDGRPQLVAPSAVATIAYDPRTGEELWRVRHEGMNASSRPLFASGLVLIAAGKDDTSLVAVSPRQGDLTENGIIWQSGKAIARRSSPLIVGELLFMVTDRGVATCRDAATGKIHWMERLDGEYWASPVSDGERVYCFSKQGDAPVFSAKVTFEQLARNSFEEGFHATPAIADHAMYVRSRHHLYRIQR